MQENQFTKKGLYSLINRLINNDCGYLIPYYLFNFALPPFSFLLSPLRLTLTFYCYRTPLAITGNRKAWLVLKELQDSGKIEIVPYQGVRIMKGK